VRDGVGALVNHYFDATLNANLPVLENPTNAEYDKGIKHSIKITEDVFATGQDKRLVNHKTYYYMAVAYGYNNFKTYNPLDPSALDGQKKPLIRGRLNVKVISAIPSIPSAANGGTTLQSAYGMGPKLTRIEGQGNGGNVLELTDETIEQILSSSDGRVISPEYKNGNGPVYIKVIDPLNVPEADFEIRFLANTFRKESIDSARWVINQLSSTGDIINSVSSDTSILVENEQLILDWGLSVRTDQVDDPGKNPNENQNGLIEASFENADVTRPWLAGIPDIDGQFPLNWIRSGTTTFPNPLPGPPNYQGNDLLGLDDGQYYEGINFGTIAPYRLVSNEVYGPAWNKNQALNSLNNLASVDLIITTDKSKWTRSPVFELQDDSTLAEGRAKKLNLRKGASVDKDGKPDGTGTGMGWFPGYAINLETGERLNIAFGENSWLVGENGRDMIWNPTSSLFSNFLAPQGFNDPLFGGMHYVYIFGHNANGPNDCPKYDNGEWIRSKLAFVAGTAGTTGDPDKRNVYKDAMWVYSPLLNPGFKMLENDVKIRIRVRKPYEMAYASNPFLPAPNNSLDPAAPLSGSPVNKNNPTYRFSTRDLAALKNRTDVAKSALDLIKAVPNPYYAYSAYERSNLENIVKITNLPEVCTVKIYSVNGTLVRSYDKDDPKTSLNWDLKNQKNIPISSGLYIIHVNVPNVGEKVIKWFGSIRPIDVDQF
jgi:hypothetical protein